ncbi:MAG: glycosyltransferase [Muribaculum sp.]|nr:glycosyltransferase [Muribaculum sp.]
MKDTPLVTVGIPAYNAERFISLAIKSVLNQTYSHFEVIITDDGSSDRTVEIARSFKDSRIKVLSDGENHGISYRLNQQIDIAKGKYFCRMDADDIMMPYRLEKQVEYLESHPDIAVVSGQAIVIDDDNKIIGIRSGKNEIHQFTLHDWISGKTLIHPTVTGTTEFFRQYHYRDEFKGVEDIDLWARACRDKSLLILPVPMIFYRDPLKFKLKTYNFRQRQAEKLYMDLSSLGIFDKRIASKLSTKSKFKSIVATTLVALHLDNIMISRRNNQVGNIKPVETYLNSVLDL